MINNGSLTANDIKVLEKIRDPECDPMASAVVDPTITEDPQITDAQTYARLVEKELDILFSMEASEQNHRDASDADQAREEVARVYRDCVRRLGGIVAEFPTYASARNNRAQALRRLYGDEFLVPGCDPGPFSLARHADGAELAAAAATVLDDLGRAISLLAPKTASSALSPQQARTLSHAHTQRAAIYLSTARNLVGARRPRIPAPGGEKGWEREQFEEAASRDFAMGGRYGCEIAKALAVGTNPTAKLCGAVVGEAMRKEYGPENSMLEDGW